MVGGGVAHFWQRKRWREREMKKMRHPKIDFLKVLFRKFLKNPINNLYIP